MNFDSRRSLNYTAGSSKVIHTGSTVMYSSGEYVQARCSAKSRLVVEVRETSAEATCKICSR